MSSSAARRRNSTRRQAGRCRGGGFTLIEILVALLILGIMSALGYGTYRAARISAEHTEAALQRTREIEFGMRMMVQDFAEAAPRPVRDILGQTRLPALQGTGGIGTLSPIPQSSSLSGSGSGSDSSPGMSFSGMSFNSGSSVGAGSSSNVAPLIELTRAGWSNTAGQQRGTLQRVSYALVDGVLKRSYQVNLDTVQGNKPVVQEVFTGVKAIQLRYLDTNQAWQNQWPAPTTVVPAGGPADTLWQRPVAIEVIIEFKDWGRIRRVVEVAG